MAVKPRDEDSFLREVDEELRRERVTGFVQRYLWWIVGVSVLVLALVGGLIWLRNHREAQAGEASAKLKQVIEQIDSNNARAAAPTIDELAESDRAGYRIAALFARANAQIASNAVPAAVATLGTIAADADAPQPYRDAALVRQTQLQFDTLPPAQVVQRLGGLAQPGNPWFGSAGEMVAIAHMRMQRPNLAGPIFANLARDPNVPASIKARAVQMASSLGIDAVPLDQSLQRDIERQGAPAAGSPPAPSAPAQQGNVVTPREGSQ